MGNYQSDQKNARRFALKLSKNTDEDLIRKLDSVVNVQGYIKELIRQDLSREQKETAQK